MPNETDNPKLEAETANIEYLQRAIEDMARAAEKAGAESPDSREFYWVENLHDPLARSGSGDIVENREYVKNPGVVVSRWRTAGEENGSFYSWTISRVEGDDSTPPIIELESPLDINPTDPKYAGLFNAGINPADIGRRIQKFFIVDGRVMVETTDCTAVGGEYRISEPATTQEASGDQINFIFENLRNAELVNPNGGTIIHASEVAPDLNPAA